MGAQWKQRGKPQYAGPHLRFSGCAGRRSAWFSLLPFCQTASAFRLICLFHTFFRRGGYRAVVFAPLRCPKLFRFPFACLRAALSNCFAHLIVFFQYITIRLAAKERKVGLSKILCSERCGTSGGETCGKLLCLYSTAGRPRSIFQPLCPALTRAKMDCCAGRTIGGAIRYPRLRHTATPESAKLAKQKTPRQNLYCLTLPISALPERGQLVCTKSLPVSALHSEQVLVVVFM